MCGVGWGGVGREIAEGLRIGSRAPSEIVSDSAPTAASGFISLMNRRESAVSQSNGREL